MPNPLGIAAVVCLVFSTLAQAQAQTKAPVLYRDTTQRGSSAAKTDDPTVVRSKNIVVDMRQLRNAETRRITLPIFGTRSMVLNRSSLERQENGLVWKGTVANQQGSSATFVVVGDAVTGNILTTGRTMYQIRYLGNGVHSLQEIDRTKFPPEGNSTEPPAEAVQEARQGQLIAAAAAPPTCTTDPATEIDVLVVFTPRTRAAAGGLAGMQGTVLLAIQETNDAYANSGVNQRVRLAHMQEVNYNESGDSTTDKNRLRNPTDGIMDEVHALRNTFAADVVMLFVEPLQNCGEAFIMNPISNAFEKFGFAVVRRTCATGNFSFGHELGHIMGARHDWSKDGTNNSPLPFNHGFVRTNPSNATVAPWRTIMGVPPTNPATGRIPFWSNPNVNFNGDPTGVATGSQPANNARTLNTTAATVANFRCGLPDKNKMWTSVGSDGKVDEKDTKKVFFDRSIAQMGQLLAGPNTTIGRGALLPLQTQSAVLRYNVTPTDTLFRVAGGIELKLQYLAAGSSAKVVANLVEVDLASGTETVRTTFNSSNFPTSNSFQLRSIAQCGAVVDRPFDFERNAYYIEVTLTNKPIVVGSAAGIRMLKLSKTDCEG
ncbi:MAG TPA: M12 family metallo-peptidase [Pyrinomonadaceae bacterium]